MQRKKKVVKTININLRQKEADYYNRGLMEDYEMSEIVRELIRKWGEETFKEAPHYIRIQEEKLALRKKELAESEYLQSMSNEEYVTRILQGIVDDGMAVFRLPNGQDYKLALNGIKEKTPDNDQLIGLYQSLLKRNNPFIQGENQYLYRLKNWPVKIWQDGGAGGMGGSGKNEHIEATEAV